MLKSFFKAQAHSFLIKIANKIVRPISEIKGEDPNMQLFQKQQHLQEKITVIQNSHLTFLKNNLSNKVCPSKMQNRNNFQDSKMHPSVKCFSRSVSSIEKVKNCRKLVEAFACLLTEKQNQELIEIFDKYLSSANIGTGKSTWKEKEMFKRTRKFLFRIVEDTESVDQILRLLSESDPQLISIQEIKRIHEFNHQERQISSRPRKYSLLLSNQSTEKNDEISQMKAFNQEMISQAKKKTLAILDQISMKPAFVRLKKPQEKTEFLSFQKSLKQAEQNLFDNKKMMSEVIILKQEQQKKEYKQKYGENWIYAYDMPYSFNRKDAKKLLKLLQKQYGEIEEYYVYPYKQMVEVNNNETYYSVPQEYNQGLAERVELGKMQMEKASKEGDKKSLTEKILQKTQKDKQLSLNKTSMVFRFKDRESKKNFLTSEMRLFGLYLGNSYTIRFQEAQSKTVLTLSMIPWSCDSEQLFSVINRGLSSLKINFAPQEPCRIARSSLFIQFTTFHDALNAQKLLNNTIFQNERLKVQLSYGASQVMHGNYKTLLEFNHHDTLVDRLKQIQCFYNDVYV